jgi:hypothetical protein
MLPSGNAVFDEETFGVFHTSSVRRLFEVFRPAKVRMATQDQVGIGLDR